MDETTIRECTTIEEFDRCVLLQREAFGLPDLELSPRRHLIVSRQAGGWTLGAFVADRMVGFVHHLAAVRNNEIFGYSHVMAVAKDYQNKGVGARLKWAQRERALAEDVKYIKWTFEPVKARNGYFNLEKLGAIVSEYQRNFYGTDYAVSPESGKQIGLQSDRLFAEWHLESEKVKTLAGGGHWFETRIPEVEIEIVNDWNSLVESDPQAGLDLQLRVREQFEAAIARGLVAGGFVRDENRPRYLMFKR